MNTASRKERERLARESEILEKAQELFCQKGFENTSMDDLAKESQYTKRTIYKYFNSKEELFFAVLLKGHEKLSEVMMSECRSGKTGFEKIRLACHAYNKFFSSYPELHSLMFSRGAVKAKTNGKDGPFRQKFMIYTQTIFEGMIMLFQEGKADGSIRSDSDAATLAYSSTFLLTGFFSMLSISGNSFTRFFNLDKEKFIETTLNLLTDALQNHK